MSGGTIWLFAAVAGLAAFTDYREGKIYNWLTFPAMAAGLVLAAAGGRSSLVEALSALALAAALFAPLFFVRVLGAGDVKLLMALATAVGVRGTLELAAASLMIAAAGAVGLLVKHGRARAVAREMWLFARSVFVRELEIHWPRLRRDITAPFGIAVFLGFICVAAVV